MKLTSIRPEVNVATMTTILSNFFNSLEVTLNYLNIIKLKNYIGDKVAY